MFGRGSGIETVSPMDQGPKYSKCCGGDGLKNVVNCILGKINLVEIEFIIANCLDMLFSLLSVNVVSVKRCENKAAHCLVGVARNLGSLSWSWNVPDPVSSIVFSELFECNE
ncbi:hypothetical protein TSUD_371410 [Trifolium subterraneum]|uniref:RNase H type-1 domain-containing protein n=1 Tax=Trifolium subterraneum TaxID=3900 RepID=A0A2Z6PB08_TRISU|nr:hypothetical protein TSUD_371410 [Trifolium subterraneum]